LHGAEPHGAAGTFYDIERSDPLGLGVLLHSLIANP
jgi:hypothetical protein